jgi:hypothetical protein
VHASEEKSDDSRKSCYEELQKGFYHIPKYHMEILLGDLIEKLGRENIFNPTIGNENVHYESNDNGVRIVNFATLKNLLAKSTISLQRNIHKNADLS